MKLQRKDKKQGVGHSDNDIEAAARFGNPGGERRTRGRTHAKNTDWRKGSCWGTGSTGKPPSVWMFFVGTDEGQPNEYHALGEKTHSRQRECNKANKNY